MPFYYVNGDTRVDIEKTFSLDHWIRLEEKTGEDWTEILSLRMLRSPKVAKAMLEECAAVTGTTLPEHITVTTLLEMLQFEALTENRPVDFEDGLPNPKATDTKPETDGSSGHSDDSDGPPT